MLNSKIKSSLATSTNSVSTIVEETESKLDAEAEHELSSDCQANMDILHPDIDYQSDSDSDELTCVDERLKNLSATKHIISTLQPSQGRLATFDLKLFSTEPVTALFDTGATCLCISFPLYNQIPNKTQIVERQF